MDLVCHENFSMAPSHKHHSKLYHGHRPHHTTPAHDEYMSSNSSSSSSDSLSPPPSLSQYSTSSTMSSGIGSSTCQSPPTSSGGPFSSLVVGAEDSNFGDLSTVTPMKSTCSSVESGAIMSSSSSSTASFANFRESVVQLVHNQPAAEPPHQHRSQSGATKRAPAQVIHYNYSPKIRKAEQDPVFLRDLCLANLFESELHHRTDGPIMGETNAQMRRIVAGWMMELCEGRECQEEVCLLALNYMDRYLIACDVRKNHLQLLGAACLLLASKLREPSYDSLTADILVYFTDNSIKKLDLIQWELLVLSALKWDISVVTPLDFLEHFLNRLAIQDLDINKVRLHAQAFICLAAQEHFMEASSTIAAASIAVSINGLHCREKSDDAGLLIVHRLVDISVSMGKLSMDTLIECMNRMESIYEEQKSKLIPDYCLNTPPNSPVNVQECAGQVVPATPQKRQVVGGDDDCSESEGDIKYI